MSTVDEVASTTIYLGSVGPDDAPGAEPLVDSSVGTAAAATAGVEVVSAPNRQGTRDPLTHWFSADNVGKHHVWNNTNGCVCEHVRPLIRELYRFGIAYSKKKVCVQPLRYLRLRAVVMPYFRNPPVYDTLRSICSFLISSTSIYTKFSVNHGAKFDEYFTSGEAKSRTNVPPAGSLQRGPSGDTPAPPPLNSRGGGGAAFGFAETTSALVGSRVLAYDAASTCCTG